MTKDQKVADVINLVTTKRTFYSKTEFIQMVTVVWDGLDAVRNIAQDGAPVVQSTTQVQK